MHPQQNEEKSTSEVQCAPPCTPDVRPRAFVVSVFSADQCIARRMKQLKAHLRHHLTSPTQQIAQLSLLALLLICCRASTAGPLAGHTVDELYARDECLDLFAFSDRREIPVVLLQKITHRAVLAGVSTPQNTKLSYWRHRLPGHIKQAFSTSLGPASHRRSLSALTNTSCSPSLLTVSNILAALYQYRHQSA